MRIGSDAVVALDYTLTDDAGGVIDESEEGEPLTYIHGHGQLVPGLEAALEGRRAGDAFKSVIAPKDGYGEKSEDAEILCIDRKELPEGAEVEVGMPLEVAGPDGKPGLLWVVAVESDEVSVGPDHPLAGMTLHFDIRVRDVRKATRDELAHGHVHGDGGHHH